MQIVRICLVRGVGLIFLILLVGSGLRLFRVRGYYFDIPHLLVNG